MTRDEVYTARRIRQNLDVLFIKELNDCLCCLGTGIVQVDENVLLVPVRAFSLLERIWGKCSIIHPPLLLLLFLFVKRRLAHAN